MMLMNVCNNVQEMLDQFKAEIVGCYIMPQLGKYEAAVSVLEHVGYGKPDSAARRDSQPDSQGAGGRGAALQDVAQNAAGEGTEEAGAECGGGAHVGGREKVGEKQDKPRRGIGRQR